MKKTLLTLSLVLLLPILIGCSVVPDDKEPLPDPEDPNTNYKVEAPEEVVSWAQYEIDSLVQSLPIEVLDREIINLQMTKSLDFHGSSTIDLYE